MKKKKMSAEEFNRATGYREGDIVQIRPDGDIFAGRVGMIIGINVFKSKRWRTEFAYNVKLSDNEGVSAPACRLRLIREAGSDEDLPESKSQFLPMCILRYPED